MTTRATADNRKKESGYDIDREGMAKAGLHIGHALPRIHPNMKPFIYGMKNGVHVIDLEKSAQYLREMLDHCKSLAAEGNDVLFVGTKIQLRDMVEQTALELSMPHVTERWIGGTFTNFSQLRKRVQYMKNLRSRLQEGEFDKYTKRERLDAEEELAKLESKFGGLESMNELPAAVFVCDLHKNDIAWKEAHRAGVEVMGIADTNVDPAVADYFVPGNDDASPSVQYVLDRAKGAILQGKQEQKGSVEE